LHGYWSCCGLIPATAKRRPSQHFATAAPGPPSLRLDAPETPSVLPGHAGDAPARLVDAPNKRQLDFRRPTSQIISAPAIHTMRRRVKGLNRTQMYLPLERGRVLIGRFSGNPRKAGDSGSVGLTTHTRQMRGSRGAGHVAGLIARTIAKMPARIAGGRVAQAWTMQASSNPISMVLSCSAPEFAPPDSVRYGFLPESRECSHPLGVLPTKAAFPPPEAAFLLL
jgi:hypothetical protein